MISWNAILAADLPLPQPTRVPRLVASDMVIILGLAGLIFAIFIGYIVFIRGSKSEIQGPSRRTRHHESSSATSDEESGSGRRRKRKRVRRRDHRQRNPTLSQTGGLPPPRDAQESSSPLG